jgi:hypothetical protein
MQNALIKYHFKIPHPERLSDDEWIENVRQLEWLADKEILGPKKKV